MSFKQSLRLPRTSFAMRANAAVREPAAASRLTDAVYNRQLHRREGRPQFVLHDGPPYANGSLHMGHLLNKVLKDIFNRHQLIQGKQVLFVPGWDCHGLPIELKALQAAREKGEEVNWVAQDPRAVRSRAGKLALEAMLGQRKDAERWGVLADWSGSSSDIYRTMDPQYEAAQLEVFAAMVQNGCIHRGTQPVHWSPSSRTALAEAELEYVDDHVSPSLFCVFPRDQQGPVELDGYPNLGAVVWTTTPWTLPANVALCVHPDLTYAVVRLVGLENPASVPESWKRPLLVAERRMAALEAVAQASLGDPNARLSVEKVVRGETLLPTVWRHPLHGAGLGLDRTAPTLPGSHVGDDAGSGIVHTAPGHGQEDFAVVRQEAPSLPVLCPVDDDGRFTEEMPRLLQGLEVQTAGNDAVLEMIRDHGTLLHTEPLRHRYPYDWRTKKPILIRTTKQWFASIGHLHDPATDALQHVQFFPDSARVRLQSTLVGRTEWCISRQRAWGVPIPVLYDKETDEPLLSSEWFEHIVALVREHGSDIWWTLEAEELLPLSLRGSGRTWIKGSDTLDVWFDSGSSWRAAWAGRERQPAGPADLVLEGSDQHRGWFQSSILTSVAVGQAAPYKAIVTHGFVLDGDGRKMSKSLGNVVEPRDVIDGSPKEKKKQGQKTKRKATEGATGGKSQQYTTPYGVDVARVWVAGSDFSRDVLLSPEIVKKASESLRKIRNVARFMLGVLETAETAVWRDNAATDSKDDFADLLHEEWMRGGSKLLREPASLTPVDQLMLARIHRFQQRVQHSFSSFATARAVSETLGFVTNDLSSFYLDVCKDRLYADTASASRRQSSEAVIWHSLRTLTLSLAPIGVFTAEDIYQHSARLFPALRDAADASADLLTNPTVSSSVFDVEWSAVEAPDEWSTPSIRNHWEAVGEARTFVHKALETARGEKALGGDLEATVVLRTHPNGQLAQTLQWLHSGGDLADVFRVSNATVELTDMERSSWSRGPTVVHADFPSSGHFHVHVQGMATTRSANEEVGEWDEPLEVLLEPLQGVRCDRCWKWVQEFAGSGVCHRCHDALQQSSTE